jgi:hypothetical protein
MQTNEKSRLALAPIKKSLLICKIIVMGSLRWDAKLVF